MISIMDSSLGDNASFILSINKFVLEDSRLESISNSTEHVATEERAHSKTPSTSSSTSSLTSTQQGIADANASHMNNLLSNDNDNYLPVKLCVSSLSDSYQLYKEILNIICGNEELNNLELNIKKDIEIVNNSVNIYLTDKHLTEKLYELLRDSLSTEVNNSDIVIKFNYDLCMSHPGNIFVKNLASSLISEVKLYEYFQSISKYDSLNKVKLFPQDSNESFAFLNFNNHLDVDHILENIQIIDDNNPFYHDNKKPLYINRYISRRERKLRQQSKDSTSDELEINFNSISLNGQSPPAIASPAGPGTTSVNTQSLHGPQPPMQIHSHSQSHFHHHSSSTGSNGHDYSTIFIENLGQFINEINPSIEFIEMVLDKFRIFGKISSAYFPLVPTDESNMNTDFKLANFGYINYEYNEGNINSLMALYYLSDLTPCEFFKFSPNSIYDIRNDLIIKETEKTSTSDLSGNSSTEKNATDDVQKQDIDLDEQLDLSDVESGTPSTRASQESTISASTNATSISASSRTRAHVKLHISIGQHKHNSHLYSLNTDQFVFTTGVHDDASTSIETLTPELHNKIVSLFIKKSNYQETNIYVNNFPILFNNDDQLWEAFWLQFGTSSSTNNGIKSAKIIKPQFYTSKSGNKETGSNATSAPSNSIGRIGFVFYEDIKMALRAILLTNGKTIAKPSSESEEQHKVNIQTSFAIQKNNSHSHSHNSLSGSASISNGGSNFTTNNPAGNPHYYNSIPPTFKRFSLPSTPGSSSSIVGQVPHSQHSPIPPHDPSILNWPSTYVSTAEFPSYYYNPYMNFTYGFHGFLPNRMSFEKDLSPGATGQPSGWLGGDSEDYEETSSPPNGFYGAYYPANVSSPIFKDAYVDGAGSSTNTTNINYPPHPAPHPILYGVPPPPVPQGAPPPHMMPIYQYYPSSVTQTNKPKRTRSKDKY